MQPCISAVACISRGTFEECEWSVDATAPWQLKNANGVWMLLHRDIYPYVSTFWGLLNAHHNFDATGLQITLKIYDIRNECEYRKLNNIVTYHYIITVKNIFHYHCCYFHEVLTATV